MDSVVFTIIGALIVLVVAILNWATSSGETDKSRRAYQYAVLLAAAFTAFGTWRGFLLNEEKTWQQAEVQFQNDWLQRRQLKERLQYERDLRAQTRELAKKSEELAKKSDEIAKLNREIASNVTGGDSYGYVAFMVGDGSSNTPRLVFLHSGKYPLYDVEIYISDMEKFKALLPGGSLFATNEEQFKFIETVQADVQHQIKVGTVKSGVTFRNGWKLPDRGKITYSVKILTRFQMFYQHLKLQRVNGRWKQAFRVFKYDENKKLLVLRESVPKDFPRDEPGDGFWLYK